MFITKCRRFIKVQYYYYCCCLFVLFIYYIRYKIIVVLILPLCFFLSQENTASPGRPPPPSRPPLPAARIRSPARPPPRPPVVSSKQRPTKDTVEIREKPGESGAEMKTISQLPRKVSPTVSRRISALINQSTHGNANNSNRAQSMDLSKNTSVFESPKFSERQNSQVDQSSKNRFITHDNPLYERVPSFEPKTKDLYSKVNKKKTTNEDNATKTATPGNENRDLHRREAIRKNITEKRKPVAGLDVIDSSESPKLSVASRTKMFDQPKNEKPTPPKKPDAIKRQSGPTAHQDSKSTKEVEAEESQREETYCDPWEGNSVVNRLKKQHPASRPVSSMANSPPNLPLDQKPSLPLLPPPSKTSSPAKTAPKLADNRASGAPDPPPKPPRTHVHDQYMKEKQQQGAFKQKAEGLADVNAALAVTEENNVANQSESKSVSVKDRISKMQSHIQESPGKSSTSISLSAKDENSDSSTPKVTMRQPPSRPPPPHRRPNSGGHSRCIRLRPLSQGIHSHDGPCIIPVYPKGRPIVSRQMSNHDRRNPMDTLPPAPDNIRPLGRYPLRRSFSSECVHGSRASCLNMNEEDNDDWSTETNRQNISLMSNSEFKAVIDPDGYAVPNEFLKLPASKQTYDTTAAFYGVSITS